MDPVHNDQTTLNSSIPPLESTPVTPPLSDTSQVNGLTSGDGRIPSKQPWTKVPILKVVTLGVLVVGLFFGLRQAQTNQDIQKSKASYCGLCSPNGDCECANDKQTGNKCKYAPPECSNLGNTWQPDSGCTANAACGSGPTPTSANEPGPTRSGPTPTSANERPGPTRPNPTPTPVGAGKKGNPKPSPTSANEKPGPPKPKPTNR